MFVFYPMLKLYDLLTPYRIMQTTMGNGETNSKSSLPAATDTSTLPTPLHSHLERFLTTTSLLPPRSPALKAPTISTLAMTPTSALTPTPKLPSLTRTARPPATLTPHATPSPTWVAMLARAAEPAGSSRNSASPPLPGATSSPEPRPARSTS